MANKGVIYDYDGFRRAELLAGCPSAHAQGGPCSSACAPDCACACHTACVDVSKMPLRYLLGGAAGLKPAHGAIVLDEMATVGRELDKQACLFLDYATHVALLLAERGLGTGARGARDAVLLHCNNSRSRSPNVLLAFLTLFRGLDVLDARAWLTAAFRAQRPAAASASHACPSKVLRST